MATYGISVYGEDTYGGLVEDELVSTGFSAQSISHGTGPGNSYGSVLVRWSKPDGSWHRQRLVRNNSGMPLDERDGDIVFEDAWSSARVSHEDEQLTVGRYYYYRLFVEDQVEGRWVATGHASALVSRDWKSTEALYRRLPEVLKSPDYNSVGSSLDDEDTFLFGFLSIFGFQLDGIRTALEHMGNALDGLNAYEGLLPALGSQVGVEYEPELGARAMRRFIANAVKLWGQKGTMPGIRGLASVITGHGAHVRIGHNLALDNVDAGPVGDVGHWRGASNCAVTYRANGAGADVPAGDGLRIVTVAAAGTAVIDTNAGGGTGLERLQYAIPVIPTLPYLVSHYVRQPPAGTTARAGLQWLNELGEPVGAVVLGDALALTETWARPYVATHAPADARYLEPMLQLEGAGAGAIVETCGFQLQEDSALRSWKPARETLVYLDASMVNHIGNTSGGEQNANGWGENVSAAYNEKHGPFLIRYIADPVDNSRVTLVDSFLATVEGEEPPEEPDPTDSYAETLVHYYGARALVESRQVWSVLIEAMDPDLDELGGPSRFARVGFQFYDGPDLIGIDLGPSVELDPTDEFHQLGHEITIPENAPYDRVELVLVSDGGVAFRRAALIQAPLRKAFFFDGAMASESGDFIWQGTPYDSPTHFYDRRGVRAARLRALLEDYVPNGSEFRLIFGVPYESIPDSPRAAVGADIDPDQAPAMTVGRRARARWTTFSLAGRSTTLPWTVFGIPVGRDASVRWYTKTTQPAATGTAGQDVTARWALSALAGKELGLAWSLRELVTVTDDLLVVDDDA